MFISKTNRNKRGDNSQKTAHKRDKENGTFVNGLDSKAIEIMQLSDVEPARKAIGSVQSRHKLGVQVRQIHL